MFKEFIIMCLSHKTSPDEESLRTVRKLIGTLNNSGNVTKNPSPVLTQNIKPKPPPSREEPKDKKSFFTTMTPGRSMDLQYSLSKPVAKSSKVMGNAPPSPSAPIAPFPLSRKGVLTHTLVTQNPMKNNMQLFTQTMYEPSRRELPNSVRSGRRSVAAMIQEVQRKKNEATTMLLYNIFLFHKFHSRFSLLAYLLEEEMNLIRKSKGSIIVDVFARLWVDPNTTFSLKAKFQDVKRKKKDDMNNSSLEKIVVREKGINNVPTEQKSTSSPSSVSYEKDEEKKINKDDDDKDEDDEDEKEDECDPILESVVNIIQEFDDEKDEEIEEEEEEEEEEELIEEIDADSSHS
jgi:hypothetical protein